MVIWIYLARPWHWIKNVFILIPLPFALAGGAKFAAGRFVVGFIGFCLITSAVYVLNDIRDVQADRCHLRKRHRPVASGAISRHGALAGFAVLLTIGLGLCLGIGSTAVSMVVLCYVGLNLVYSMGAKHCAIVDVFLLAAGYVLRVYLGCFLIDVSPSNWLLLCSAALAFFLALAKRRADLAANVDTDHRPSLRGYSVPFLDKALNLAAGVALLSYAVYTVNSDVLRPGRQLASLPFVAYGILNYLRLSKIPGATASPVDVAYRSRSMQLCGLGWLLAVLWSLK
ncbi:MAG: hypothetical protein A2W31_06490 [Planctomycetes bacterium RBG_16_64_10]|nr:MAG: hypothetical protein A2W31_06490 [Planctomycetes bacterium RBG_16_64_10]